MVKEEDSSQVAVGLPIEFQSIDIDYNLGDVIVAFGPGSHNERLRVIVTSDTDFLWEEESHYFEHDLEGFNQEDADKYVQALIEHLLSVGFEEGIKYDITFGSIYELNRM